MEITVTGRWGVGEGNQGVESQLWGAEIDAQDRLNAPQHVGNQVNGGLAMKCRLPLNPVNRSQVIEKTIRSTLLHAEQSRRRVCD